MTRLPAALVGLALWLLATTSAAAQDTLTLDAAVQAATAQNASLRAARARQTEADAAITAEGSGRFPRLSITESWQRGDQPVFVFSSLLAARRFTSANFAIDALNHPDSVGLFRTTIGAEQVLFDGGRQRAATRIATARYDIAHLFVDEATAALALSVTESFGRILAAQASAQAADAGLVAAREDLALTERRRDAGVATEADVLAIAVHVAQLRQQSIQASADGGIARAELNRMMGAPIERAFRPVEPADASFADLGGATSLAMLFAEADAARPELRRAAAVRAIADASQRQARAALLPQVVTQAALEVSGTRLADRAASWLVGGELRWTFSTGGAQRAGLTGAAAAVTRAQAEADEARAAVHVDVASAALRVNTARARQAVGRAAVDQARESQRIIRDRYEAGLVGVADVLRASAAVLDADANRISALVDTIVSTAMLRRALGRNP